MERGSAPLGDPAFAALKSRLVARTGHHYYADKDDLLWERIGRRMRVRGVGEPAGYLALLEGSEAEWAALEAEITIGETFFFRYAEQFAALRGTILPERIAARSDERRLRIWSAGCSTGPETHSVAIVLHELLGERLPEWRIGLTGTDINRDVLAVARRGVYGTWALRTLGAEERERYFRPGPRAGTFALRPDYRGLARFEPQNLMSLIDGTASLALTDYDLILCRNVLIYFHPDTVQALVRALAQRLRPGGWLLLGHAEPNPAFADFLQVVSLPGTAAYRRPEDGATEDGAATRPPTNPLLPPVPPEPAWAPLLPPQAELPGARNGADLLSVPAGREGPRPSTSADGLVPRVEPGADVPPGPLASVRALADAGDLDASWRACRAALGEDPTDPRLRYYEGLLARARARPDEAERAFRGAVYLDKGFVMAHYHLGLTLIAAGRAEAGRRAVANAVRLAASLPADAVLPEGDGLTAADLSGAARPFLDGAGA
ncbi:CheR family methyltransferase [Methylobacterium platani]|uniref:protein-glutamate O-methyltransferase n=2 Tax=Methylobacterium platani TaxID=427683 RepID=A0A179RYC9_9HYPH|nr:protein-glutamate O-methyltransferase CheR [Methylobacterium platani]KMO22130.1 protein-glutamate methyltransferase [Methylobacterium platani JCM 14648]OAS15194.1 protein-glutamate methyltransferase [Methylobacterium platani]